VLELVHDHEVVLRLEELHRVARQDAAGKSAGRQKSRGLSWRGSPVRGSKTPSPPGFKGAKFLLSNTVAADRPRCAPGRWVGH
jgi:hypothetical protein